MKRAGLRPHTRLHPSFATTILLVVAACVVAGGAAACPGVASARTLARGIADPTLTQSISPADQATAVHAIRSELGATYVRFVISWAATEPTGPTVPTPYGAPIPYDPSSPYMTSVAAAITQAHADHLKVLITFQDVPKWASNPAYWGKSGYHANDALLPTAANLSYFSAFCRAVATQFRGQVYAYECWNEPNLYLSLYPQATSHDHNFAAHLYVQMLRSFSKGIHNGDPKALRVAGATAPRGSYRPYAYSTSPQRFAAVIKATKGWSLLFDAYSHHPYMPGASPRTWPEAAPANPNATVTLQNLGTLLKMFPTKPFFLTEYGYQTAPCQAFGGQHVNQVTQANYLRRAYAYAARYKQVKMLIWYLVKDFAPPGRVYQLGFFTGLQTAGGVYKPAWYVFAGDDHLSLNSSAATVKRAARVTLSGQLACTSMGGGLAAKPLVVQSRRAGRPWTTIKTIISQAAGPLTSSGHYTLQLRPKASAYYRVAWLGVVTSRTRYVAVK